MIFLKTGIWRVWSLILKVLYCLRVLLTLTSSILKQLKLEDITEEIISKGPRVSMKPKKREFGEELMRELERRVLLRMLMRNGWIISMPWNSSSTE